MYCKYFSQLDGLPFSFLTTVLQKVENFNFHQFIFLFCASLSQKHLYLPQALKDFLLYFLLKKLYFWDIDIHVCIPFQVKFHVLFFSHLEIQLFQNHLLKELSHFPHLFGLASLYKIKYILTMYYIVHLYPGLFYFIDLWVCSHTKQNHFLQ